MIDGIEIQYTIETKDIFAVLGSVYIYRPVTFLDTIRIIYRGLQRNCGYSYDEFQAAVMKGNIYPSKKEGTLSPLCCHSAHSKQSQVHQ